MLLFDTLTHGGIDILWHCLIGLSAPSVDEALSGLLEILPENVVVRVEKGEK